MVLVDKYLIFQVPWKMYGDWLKLVRWLYDLQSLGRNVTTYKSRDQIQPITIHFSR